MTPNSNQNRLVRIESKITRICHALGLDSDGNPSGLLVLSLAETNDVIAAMEDACEWELAASLRSKMEARWKI